MPISIPTSVAGISVPGAINGPLSLLYGNKYLKTNLAFPRDLGSNPARNHVILFDIQVPSPDNKPLAPNNLLKDLGSGIAAGAVATLAQGGLAVANLAGNTTGASAAQATIDAQQPAIQAGIKATAELAGNITGVNLKKISSTSIALYIPDTVNVSYEASYNDQFSLTGALGTPYLLAQGAVSVFDAMKAKGSTAESVINQSGNDAAIRKALGEGANKLLGTQGLGDLALGAGGYAMNPQLQVLFQGIGFRHFQFDFVLTPSTKEESITINKIIAEFKKAAAPEFMTNGILTQSVYLKIPNSFKIKFLYNGAENLNVHKIEECVLSGINVDYAPNGWSTFNNGAPVQTRLTLQFIETVIIDKKKIGEGY
jgi:hypothetical protein